MGFEWVVVSSREVVSEKFKKSEWVGFVEYVLR